MTALDISKQLDDLKIVTLTDGEVWSARDLQEFAGYTEWRKWSGAIDRAIDSVNASGLDASDHFVGTAKMIQTGKGARREIEDVELTRYACYILFQNADARKPEIAALQQYFAVQTRKQELNVPGKLAIDPTSTDGISLILAAAQNALNKAIALEAKVEADAPKVLFAETVATSDGSILVAQLGTILKQNGVDIGEKRLFERLRSEGFLCKGGSDHNRPTQRAMDMGLFEVVERTYQSSDGSPRLSITPKVTGRGQVYFINRYVGEKAA